MTMNEQHIASAFDRDLEAIQAMIMKMGGLVERDPEWRRRWKPAMTNWPKRCAGDPPSTPGRADQHECARIHRAARPGVAPTCGRC
jgi:hypothetical protein